MERFTEEERLEFALNHKAKYPENVIAPGTIIGEGTVIGTDGFGYVRKDDGTLVKMPHAGNVIIEKDVEIGSNTCLDRAVIGSTIIGEGTKIDNLVHIAHGVKIGKNCLIVAGTIIGGSSVIGDNCYLGIGCMIKNKITIGANSFIGMGTVVLCDVPDGEVWVGNPAKFLRKLK